MGALYRGFSTSNYLNTKQGFTLTNTAIVKRDLLNFIFTRRGSRLKQPDIGTDIPDLVFEQLDEETLAAIREELDYAFNYDPRVELINMNIIPLPDYNAVVASCVILYVELNMQDRFDIHIDFHSNG